MSVAPFTPPPLAHPDVSDVVGELCPSFFDSLLDTQGPHWKRLPLDARHRIDVATLAYAEAILKGEVKGQWGFAELADHTGPQRALDYCHEGAMRKRWELIREAVEDRERAVRIMRRVHCGARKRDGAMCRGMAEPGANRCRFHGGRSTGPTTPEGRKRALANLAQYRARPALPDTPAPEPPAAPRPRVLGQ